MKKNIIKKFSWFGIGIISFLLTADFAQAQGHIIIQKMRATIDSAKLDLTGLNAEPESILSKLIVIVLSFLGVAFLVLMIYGGILWMFARGNEDQVTKAKQIIMNSSIGLGVIIGAYAITTIIIEIYGRTL